MRGAVETKFAKVKLKGCGAVAFYTERDTYGERKKTENEKKRKKLKESERVRKTEGERCNGCGWLQFYPLFFIDVFEI